MEQLIYASEAREGLGSEEVFSIVQTSSRRNPEREVTGFLIFRAGKFFQFLEGPTEQLNCLLDDLEKDSRHHSIVMIERSQIKFRSFPGWLMKRVRPGVDLEELDDVFRALRERGEFSKAAEFLELFLERQMSQP